MTDLTTEQKIQVNLNLLYASIINDEKVRETFIDSVKSYAAIINDEEIRKTFIDCMIGTSKEITDAEMNSIRKFVTAVDFMIGALGYGIFDEHAAGGPVPIASRP